MFDANWPFLSQNNGKTYVGRYEVTGAILHESRSNIILQSVAPDRNHVILKVCYPVHRGKSVRSIPNTEDCVRWIRGVEVHRRVSSLGSLAFPTLIEDFVENGCYVTVMQHIRAVTLRSFLESLPAKKMSLPSLLRFCASWANAIALLHQTQSIHRDICPDNVFRGSPNEAILFDFDIAIRAETDVTATPLGRKKYWAPEVRLGQPCFASDQFSFGCSLYEAIAGTTPFLPDTVIPARAAHHRMLEIASLSKVAPDTPQSVCDLVHKCLAFLPHERYADMNEVASEIGRLLADGDETEIDDRRPIDGNFLQVHSEEEWQAVINTAKVRCGSRITSRELLCAIGGGLRIAECKAMLGAIDACIKQLAQREFATAPRGPESAKRHLDTIISEYTLRTENAKNVSKWWPELQLVTIHIQQRLDSFRGFVLDSLEGVADLNIEQAEQLDSAGMDVAACLHLNERKSLEKLARLEEDRLNAWRDYA